jgi:hypothetical protein
MNWRTVLIVELLLIWLIVLCVALWAQNGTVQSQRGSQFIVLSDDERAEKLLIEARMQLLVQQNENLRLRVCMRQGVPADECGPWDNASGNLRRMVKSSPPPPPPPKSEAAKPEVKKQP